MPEWEAAFKLSLLSLCFGFQLILISQLSGGCLSHRLRPCWPHSKNQNFIDYAVSQRSRINWDMQMQHGHFMIVCLVLSRLLIQNVKDFYEISGMFHFYFLKLKFFQRLLMVAWTPGLFSLLGGEIFFPEPTDFFLSPLALAGPNIRTFRGWPWLLDFSFDRPET